MRFTYNWLKEHLDTTATPQEIADKLTSLGLEVEDFTDLGKKYEPFIIAEIKEAEKHPNADKLRVCKVNTGKEELQIVCGAPNARAGIKVILAPVGALIPNSNFQIKKSKIRDVESNGMLCSADELELGTDSAGIVELPTDAPIGGKYADFAKMNDSLFEIAITPNRADCLGVYGIARDLAASGMGTLKSIEIKSKIKNQKSKISVTSNSYYIGCYISNVTNSTSDDFAGGKLKAVGQTPISTLVDITNYITLDFGRPLHVYDADKLKGNVQIREAKKGEKLNALNNKSYEMQGGELVVADDNGIIALAGVIGNVETSVTPETKNVFLEVAWFDPIKVAESGRRHMIDSDARYRFERGIDPEFVQKGADIASSIITTLCGGEASEYVTSGTKPNSAREISYDFTKIKSFAGIEISEVETQRILTNLGFKFSDGEPGGERAISPRSGVPSEGQQARTGNIKKINIPSWRADVEGMADLAEEILRVHGYDKAASIVLPYASQAALPTFAESRNTARAILTARGFTETVNYSFTDPKLAAAFANDNIKLLNPISSELSEMRPSILPSLLQAAEKNLNRGFKNLSLFEIGPIFFKSGEQIALAGIITGQNSGKNWYGKPRNVDVFDAKVAIFAVLESLGIKTSQLKSGAADYYHPGHSGTISLGKNVLGYFGELHPATLKASNYDENAVGFELFLANIPESTRKYKKLETSDFQTVNRDFAFVVDSGISAENLLNFIKKTDILIENSQIFDVYQGEKLPAGKKSLAVTIQLKPKDKTLTDQDIETISKKVVDGVSTKFSATLRQ